MVRARILSLALLIACLAPGLAWKGENSGRVQPIATVLAKAELGDIVAIEGSVANTTTGGGSRMVALLKDDSGEVMVVVPDSLIRKLDMRTGEVGGWPALPRDRSLGSRADGHGNLGHLRAADRTPRDALTPARSRVRESGPGFAARRRRSSRRPAPDPARRSGSARG